MAEEQNEAEILRARLEQLETTLYTKTEASNMDLSHIQNLFVRPDVNWI